MGLAAFAERCGRDCTRSQGGGARALLTSTPYSPSFGHTGPQDHSHKLFTALALSQEHQERRQDGVGSKAQPSCNLRVWLSPGASARSVPRLRPVLVLLPTHGGQGTGPAAVPRARYRERQLQRHPLPGHQPGSHRRAGTSGTQWGSPNKDGTCTWPPLSRGPGARDGREAPGAPEAGPLESRLAHSRDSRCWPTQWPWQPHSTAGWICSQPRWQSVRFPRALLTGRSTSKLGMGAPGVQESCYPSCSLPRG